MPALPAKPFYQDGDYTSPVMVWTSPRTYPFASEGDLVTYIYKRRYLVAWASYTPTQPGMPDPLNPSGYLVEEIPPEGGRTPLAEFERTYSTIPSSYDRPGSLYYSLPELTGNIPSGYNTNDFYKGIIRSRDTKDPEIYTVRSCIDSANPSAATGGTFTLTVGGVTTAALAYNATAGTIATALNALPAITPWGTVTATGTPSPTNYLRVSFPAFSPGFTINAANLTTQWGHPVVTSTATVTAKKKGYRLAYNIGTNNSSFQALGVPMTMDTSAVVNLDYAFFRTDNSNSAGIFFRLNSKNYEIPLSGSVKFTLAGVSVSLAIPFSRETVYQAFKTLFGTGADIFSVNVWENYGKYPEVSFAYRPAVNGGTYTLTAFGQTTAPIAWDASITTITAALNALSSISNRGGAQVDEVDPGFHASRRIEFELVPPSISGDASSLTGLSAPYKVEVNQVLSLTYQDIRFPFAGGARVLVSPDHGFRSGTAMGVYGNNGTWSYFDSSSNTITVLDKDRLLCDPSVAPFSTTGVTIQKVAMLVLTYSRRSVRLRSNSRTTFYLTGPAINAVSLADIQPEESQIAPEKFFEALTAGATNVIYDESDVQQWRGPIYSKTLTTISLSGLA